jgi:hypothetical protein
VNKLLSKWTGLCALLLLFSACATVPPQAFNREAAAKIKTVVIAQRPNQTEYGVRVVSPGTYGTGGLVGGLIEDAESYSRSKRLAPLIKADEMRLQDRFSAKLQEKLNAMGYSSKIVVLPNLGGSDADLLAKLKQHAQADAYLVLPMHAQYAAIGLAPRHSPWVSVSPRLLEGGTAATLYAANIDYGFAVPFSGPNILPSLPQHQFADFEALLADPAKAAEGLLAGLDALAARVAADLKSN